MRLNQAPLLLLLGILFLIGSSPANSQNHLIQEAPDTVRDEDIKEKIHAQKDIIDVMAALIKSPGLAKHNSVTHKTGRIHFSAAPGLGYTLSTGLAAILASNSAFYTSEDADAKLSNIFADVVYTQNRQLITHIQGTIWTKHNKYNIITDWRYLKYPQKTYGLGGHTDLNNSFDQDYSYLRLYQAALKKIAPNFYAGLGYSLDYHWNISESSTDIFAVSDAQLYGLPEKTTSSGLTLNVMFDDRNNSINPDKGTYANIVVRDNATWLGSDQHWQSLRMDLRKYYSFPRNSDNVLAFWSFNWLTLGGEPPYLDLPSTGWDPYNNMGRGYIQGRFRGKNLLYLESEYRFKLTHNGLIGGVVFVNAQTVSEWHTNKFEVIAPAGGAGLRLKFNKHSKTNVAIDYGFGTGGSQGFFLNLGEVF